MTHQAWTALSHAARHCGFPFVPSRMLVLLERLESRERKRELLQQIEYGVLLILSFSYLIYLTVNASIHL
jgi:hypothetical protein